MVAFAQIPSTIRVPFFGVEFDNSNAVQGPTIKPYKILAIGQRLAAGTVAKHVPTRITSPKQAKTFFGAGSMLAQMLEKLYGANSFTETWGIALDDDPAGVKATGTLTFTGPATAAGVIYLYIGGRRLTVGVAAADTATAIATNVAAAINAATAAAADLAVTAVAALAVVTLSAKHKCLAGNYIDIRLNANDGEDVPAGTTAAIVPMAAGASNPDIAAAIAALGDTQYDVIAFPYTDAVSLNTLEPELVSRFGPLRAIEGVAIAAHNGDNATVTAFGATRNCPHLSVISSYDIKEPPWEVAGSAAGVIAFNANIDPARQFRGLPLPGISAPRTGKAFMFNEKNLCLYNGISVISAPAGGGVSFERVITTYKTNSVGADDPSYLDIMTPMLLGYLRYDWRNHILRKYPRHKLANDGTRFDPDQPIITPLIGKAEAVTKFRQWEGLGYVENFAQFKRDLICERNATDPNRLDWRLSPDLINNFMVGGTKISFLLQGL